jgi:phage shock protein A
MNLLERVLTLLRANLNAVVEKSDDPEKALRQLQLDMRNQLVQVKTQVATAIAESRKLQSRANERQAEAAASYQRAEQALRQNNESAAREHLMRYNDLLRTAQRYQQQQQEQEQLVSTMKGVLRRLESKISEVEASLELLIARKRNAILQQRVYEALSKTGVQVDKEKERANRAQDAVMEAEAKARAMADLHQRNLDIQLDQLSEEQLVEQQLRELRNKQQGTQKHPLLEDGNADLSELLKPRPRKSEPSEQQPGTNALTTLPSTPQQPASEPLTLEELKRLMEK